jgi:hypothetical protein
MALAHLVRQRADFGGSGEGLTGTNRARPWPPSAVATPSPSPSLTGSPARSPTPWISSTTSLAGASGSRSAPRSTTGRTRSPACPATLRPGHPRAGDQRTTRVISREVIETARESLVIGTL